MTAIRLRHPRRWTPDVEIPLRAVLFDSTSPEYYKNESELRGEISGRLAQNLLDPASFIAEYRDPLTGIWMSCGGWAAGSFGTPQLSPEEVASLAPETAAADLRTYGEAMGWIAFDAKPEDVLESLVLAGWVPSQAGIDLAIKARRHVDDRDAT